MSLVFDNVSYSYEKDGNYAVKDVSFTLEDGKLLGIIGHTGSGKSTLTKMMNALITPSSGRVLVDGEDIDASKEEQRKVKSKVALVFQYPDYQFFSSTVFDDIAFGPRNMGVDEEEMMRRIKKAMHKVGFDFDEISQRSPFELSGGQKRRLAIAEALVMKPKIMVLDEPMAGLDPRGRAALAKLLRTLREDGVTLILVSHNMEDIAELSDEILGMKDGPIFMQGTPREIFIHPTELREIDLGIPIETRFANWLSEAGMPMPECVIGLDELVDAIAVAFKERAYE